jgi:hypothetical protein
VRSNKIKVTTQVERLKVDRLKEKTAACAAGAAGRCAITQSQDRLDTPACAAAAGWQVSVSWMIIIALQCSAFSLNTWAVTDKSDTSKGENHGQSQEERKRNE